MQKKILFYSEYLKHQQNSDKPRHFQCDQRRDPLYFLTKNAVDDLGDLAEYEQVIVEKLSASRQAVLELDARLTSRQDIIYVVPMYREINRLLPPEKSPTGEDFLRVKIRQLDYLFQGTQHFAWRLLFLDREEGTDSTAEFMRSLLADSVDLYPFKDRVEIFSPSDLQDELLPYRKYAQTSPLKEIFAETTPDARMRLFMETQYKGGQVQLLLRRALKYNPCVVLYTDCDTSHNLGHTGLLLKELYDDRADMVIASRRLPGSVVVNKSAEQHAVSAAYNLAVRILTGLDIADTQSGLKAMWPAVLKDILVDSRALGMAFDVEFLESAEQKGWRITEVPTVWVDSPFESKSANPQMREKMYKELLIIHGQLCASELGVYSQLKLLNELICKPDGLALLDLPQTMQTNFWVLLNGLRGQKVLRKKVGLLLLSLIARLSVKNAKLWRRFWRALLCR
jgi:hypothetical protein